MMIARKCGSGKLTKNQTLDFNELLDQNQLDIFLICDNNKTN